MLGARSYACLEFDDLSIVFDNVSRRKVAGLLRRIDARIVMSIAVPPLPNFRGRCGFGDNHEDVVAEDERRHVGNTSAAKRVEVLPERP